MQCSRCRRELPSTAKFCPTCGATTVAAPLPPSDGQPTRTAPDDVGVGATSRRSIAPFVMTAVVLAALVVGGIAVIGTRDSHDEPADGGTAGGSAPTTSPATSSEATTANSTAASTATSTTSTTMTLPADPNAVALTALAETIDTDRPSVDAHLGRWVPQISAKRDGIRWEGTDYGFPEILGLHRDLDARYGALLVSGAEYNFRIDDDPMAGWFITIVDESHPDPDGALAWCRLNDIDRDNCAAKLITNEPDPGQTLVLQ